MKINFDRRSGQLVFKYCDFSFFIARAVVYLSDSLYQVNLPMQRPVYSITYLAPDQSLTRNHIVQHQVQMITAAHLGQTIPRWAPPAFQVSGNPLADRRNQRMELVGRGGIDPMKSQLGGLLGEKAPSIHCLCGV